MNIPKDIVTPDEKGKIFTTDANDAADLKILKLSFYRYQKSKK
jgi:hypothetical protein